MVSLPPLECAVELALTTGFEGRDLRRPVPAKDMERYSPPAGLWKSDMFGEDFEDSRMLCRALLRLSSICVNLFLA